MWGRLFWCTIPRWMGVIREAVKKHFLRNSVVDLLEARQFVLTQLQWDYFLSLYTLHLDPDAKGLRLLYLESIAALEGQAHR